MSNIINLKIPNDSIITEFKRRLDLDFNQRILFTAPFGAGKSTFINDFEEQHKEEYRFIKLYPVNYAVSANEDIFELIKFDILHELLTHYQDEINLELEDFDFWLRMSMFIQNKTDLMPLFLLILSQNEKIGKSAAIFIGALDKVLKPLKKGFKEYSEQIKIDELKDISKFLESFRNKKGTAYEMNTTSKFIHDLVSRLKENDINKEENNETEDVKNKNKTVLVIDDLDRLDPEHIFRLFNIFSAHTHSITGENKFGFDKVIFVCDIENIRKIYAHKYGEGVDFSGYMDKFYSVKPFIYNNFKYLQEKVVAIIDRSTFKNQEQKEIIKQDSVVYLLSAVLKILSKNKAINLRSLLKSNSFLVSTNDKVKIKENIILWKDNIPLLMVFEVISEMLGGWHQLERALLLVKQNSSHQYYFNNNQKFWEKYSLADLEYGNEIDYIKREIFKVFVVENLKNEMKTGIGDKIIQLNDFNLNIIYSLSFEDIADFNIKYITEIGGNYNIDYHINYDLLLIEAFIKLREYGFIPNTNY